MENNSFSIVVNNGSIIGPERKLLSQTIIDVYGDIQHPWDNLLWRGLTKTWERNSD